MRPSFILCLLAACAVIAACGDESPTATAPVVSLDGDGGYVDAGVSDGAWPRADGGYVDPTGSVIRADRFVTHVVSFTPGPCAGFGASEMPSIVTGPPAGTGTESGSLDVVSLGIGGEVVVSFEPNGIVDGPGVDFIVFENAFVAGTQPYADLAEVSVSEDGSTWTDFPCTPGTSAPYGTCAGWHPVYSAPSSNISPIDPEKAGGDPYDLASVGITKARFVRIRDKGTATCGGQPKPTNLGFDLDAIAIIHAETP